MFKNIEELFEYLDKLPRKRHMKMVKKTLELLGDPQEEYKKIIISGTNGKGSTLMFLKSLIMSKYNVGSFSSPHINRVNERITYNYNNISDDEMINLSKKIVETNIELSYFEFLTVMAFLYFKEKKVEYAIIETGIGGLNDATNEICYDLSIITSISYDHQDKLGNTLEEIALNKLGIVKNNKLIFACSNEIFHFMWLYMLKNNIDYTYVSKNETYIYESLMCSFLYDGLPIDLNVIGKNQAINAMIAIEAIKYLDIDLKKKKIKKHLEEVFLPLRLERCYLNPLVLIDGGHNIEACLNIIDNIKNLNKRIIIIYSSCKDKDYERMIREYEKIASHMAFTEIDYERIERAKVLYDICNIDKSYNLDYKELIVNTIESADKNDLIVITGSFYFCSLARKIFRK